MAKRLIRLIAHAIERDIDPPRLQPLEQTGHLVVDQGRVCVDREDESPLFQADIQLLEIGIEQRFTSREQDEQRAHPLQRVGHMQPLPQRTNASRCGNPRLLHPDVTHVTSEVADGSQLKGGINRHSVSGRFVHQGPFYRINILQEMHFVFANISCVSIFVT